MELRINDLKEKIINGINESELPLSLVSYILKDIIQEVDALRAQELKQAQQEQVETELETLEV